MDNHEYRSAYTKVPRDRANGPGLRPTRTERADMPEPIVTGARMTIRIYRVDRAGLITEDRGVTYDGVGTEALHTGQWPPCQCPRHRGE